MTAADRDPARRELVLAIGAALACATVLLVVSGQTWLSLSLTRVPPEPPIADDLSGTESLAALIPCAVVIGAAGLALIATRRLGRMFVGGAVILAGALAVVAVAVFLLGGASVTATSWAQDRAPLSESVSPDYAVSVVPAVVVLVAGLAATGVGGLIVARGRRWPVMGARYERPGQEADSVGSAPEPAASDPPEPSGRGSMWAALDRGEDPTDGPVEPR